MFDFRGKNVNDCVIIATAKIKGTTAITKKTLTETTGNTVVMAAAATATSTTTLSAPLSA